MASHCQQFSPLGTAAILLLLAPASMWGAQRTFVSAGSGSDSNLCTRQLPCRNFAAAIAQTDPGGEVVVLDAGGYGTVTISQAVTIVATGVHAAVTAFDGRAIIVSATTTDVVILRGLYLTGLGGGWGIDFQTGKTLHVEGCVISGFENSGFEATASNADVYIKDTISRQNFNGFLFQSDTAIRASLESIRAEENINGVLASFRSLVTVTRGVIAGNTFGAIASGSTPGVINLESCTITMNSTGIRPTQSSTIRVANSIITGNASGILTESGSNTVSLGSNRVAGNGFDGTFTATIAQQ